MAAQLLKPEKESPKFGSAQRLKFNLRCIKTEYYYHYYYKNGPADVHIISPLVKPDDFKSCLYGISLY